MLGKLIRVRITDKIGSPFGKNGGVFKLNHGQPIGRFFTSSPVSGVLVCGIDNPVNHFDGRVIALIRFLDNGEVKLVAAPKSKKLIDCEIKPLVQFIIGNRSYALECYYERSCGAVIFRKINGSTRFLLIKNKRSSNWGFPKGHMEDGENMQNTAKREVLEETGIHINILPGFISKSQYSIQNKIEKTVYIFIGETDDMQTIIQREEIEDYIWLTFDSAYESLKFENDRAILKDANEFLINHNYIEKT